MKAESASKGIKLNFATKTRSGSTGSGLGGHWNAKLRRFTVPAELAGTRVGFATAGDLVVVTKVGDFAVHKTQRFVNVPKATAELLGETRSLEVVPNPEVDGVEVVATYKI